MNCTQCGAPMQVSLNNDSYYCRYCGSYEFINPNKDGVILLGETVKYICPQCKKALVTAKAANIDLLSCKHCKGNLISQPLLLNIIKQVKVDIISSEELGSPQENDELLRIIDCPICSRQMESYPYGAASGNIIIQGCGNCNVVWLDFGDLYRIEKVFTMDQRKNKDENQQDKEFFERNTPLNSGFSREERVRINIKL
jgi:Zn-finger nucleic acid-binding protein